MVDRRYQKAFKEVNEVLLHTDTELTNKIPLKFRKFLEENMDKEYNFCIQENLSLEQQGISKETENILALIYRTYWATQAEKEEFIKKDEEERRLNEEKLNNIFSNRQTKKAETQNKPEERFKENKKEINKEETQVIKVEEAHIIKKIILKIKRIFLRK